MKKFIDFPLSDAANIGANEFAQCQLEPPKSLCGRVVNAAIWEEHHWQFVSRSLSKITCSEEVVCEGEHVVRVGSYVRLRNINDGLLRDPPGSGEVKRCE